MMAMRKVAWWAATVVLTLALAGPARAAEKADRETTLVENLGVLAGVHLYQTHANIGLINDARAKGVYDDKVARQHLLTALNLIALVDTRLDTLSKTNIPKDDQTAFQKMRRLNGLLRKQAETLKAFWDSKDKKDLEAFVKVRAETSAKIGELLGFGK
jgi:hypothetical protein